MAGLAAYYIESHVYIPARPAIDWKAMYTVFMYLRRSTLAAQNFILYASCCIRYTLYFMTAD